MSAYNRFGLTASQVVALIPGMVSADLGGDSAVEAIIDRYVQDVTSQMPEAIFRAITRPTQIITVYEGNSVLTPWFAEYSTSDILLEEVESQQPCGPGYEVESTEYTVNTDGTISLSSSVDEDMVYRLTLSLTNTDTDFSVDSLAALVNWGAASEISSVWGTSDSMSQRLRKLYDSRIMDLKQLKWIPQELLAYQFCPALSIRSGRSMQTIPMWRG